MRLAEFERDAAAFSSALNRERYLQGAGLKAELEISPIFESYRHLFDPETFDQLRGLPLDPPFDEKYRRFLLAFIAESYFDFGARQYTDAIATAEATTTIEWRGEELTYRGAPLAWANEPDPDRRHELYALWRAACEEINPRRADRHRAIQELVPNLESGDYVELWDSLGGLRLGWLAERMTELLDSTADLHHDTLRDALADHQLTLDSAERSDLASVFRGIDFDTRFPREQLLPTLIRTLHDLGFELEEQRNIMLDVESRPTKSPRAFCAPIQIPDDVRLVLQPQGGHQDYETLLHEAGHAQHFGNTDRGLPFAHRWAGDNSVTEGYAFLLHYMITDSLWLRRQLDFDDSEGFRHFALFQKLQMLRRYAAKLHYELELQRAEEPEPLAERYADLLSHHQMVRYFPEEYLADVDDAFYAARYLRAWTFEAQLREFLKKEYDEEWFRAPRAGRFIRDLWREGQRNTVDELVRFMGYDDLDPNPMLNEIQEALAR